jgi:hypothetical protein
MQAPFLCDYQTASYTLIVQASTHGVELTPLVRQSVYTGWNRSIVEIITTGLQINYNYTLIITVMEEHFETEVSSAANFCKLVMHIVNYIYKAVLIICTYTRNKL